MDPLVLGQWRASRLGRTAAEWRGELCAGELRGAALKACVHNCSASGSRLARPTLPSPSQRTTARHPPGHTHTPPPYTTLHHHHPPTRPAPPRPPARRVLPPRRRAAQVLPRCVGQGAVRQAHRERGAAGGPGLGLGNSLGQEGLGSRPGCWGISGLGLGQGSWWGFDKPWPPCAAWLAAWGAPSVLPSWPAMMLVHSSTDLAPAALRTLTRHCLSLLSDRRRRGAHVTTCMHPRIHTQNKNHTSHACIHPFCEEPCV